MHISQSAIKNGSAVETARIIQHRNSSIYRRYAIVSNEQVLVVNFFRNYDTVVT